MTYLTPQAPCEAVVCDSTQVQTTALRGAFTSMAPNLRARAREGAALAARARSHGAWIAPGTLPE